MSELTRIRIDVLESFSNLQDKLADFQSQLVKDTELVSWLQDAPAETCGYRIRELAFSKISQLEYHASQAPREIILCVGFVGASQDTLQQAYQLNLAKLAFKSAMLALKAAKLDIEDDYLTKTMESILGQRDGLTGGILKKMGLSRLHLKQCYRQLPILTQAPTKISWTWAHTRSIKRISKEQALKMLTKKGNDRGIELQTEKLKALADDEALAVVQDLAPHLRSNIVFGDKTTGVSRLMVKGSLPLFFPADAGTESPQFKAPKAKEAKDLARQSRGDQKIDPVPFLPAIHAHRYLMKTTHLDD